MTPHGKLPAESTFRSRLEDIANMLADSQFQVIIEANAEMIKFFRIDPGAIKTGNFYCIPVDLDVSPFDNSKTKKEGLGRTYKEVDGFAPMFVYIGTHGLPIMAEFREGSQHCQKGTPDLLLRLVPLALDLTDKPLLYRFDSGNDAAENMWILSEEPRNRFLIKRNFRKLNKDKIALQLANTATTVEKPREGKTVYTGSTPQMFERKNAKGEKETLTVRAVFQITERTSTWYGQQMIVPEREIDMWHTNLDKEEASDLDIIEMLIQIPCHFTKHARRKNASLGRGNPWADVFLYVLDRIRSFATSYRSTSPVAAATG